MIDWIIQILRVLELKSDRTLFLGMSILDRFFKEQANRSRLYHSDDIHLYGLVSCFIASKIEEPKPITMEEVLNQVGHGKFDQDEILLAERKILQVLEYKVLKDTLIDKVFILLDEALSQASYKTIEFE